MKRFWVSRLKTIAYPYFIWSFIQGSIQIALSSTHAVNNALTFEQLFDIWREPIAPFWFLYSLFFCNIIGVLLKNVRNSAAILISLVLFIGSYYLHEQQISDIAWGFLYFYIGILVRQFCWPLSINATLSTIIILFEILCATALLFYFLGVAYRFAIPTAVLGGLWTLAMSTAIQKSKKDFLKVFFDLAGRYSMGIFVQHVLVLGLARTLLLRIFNIHSAVLVMLFAIPFAIVVPIAVQALTVRIRVNEFAGLPYSANVSKATSVASQSAGPPPDSQQVTEQAKF